jgi:hypothetical protein
MGGRVTGDIFESITPGAIAFARPNVSVEPQRPELSVELAGPWNFYSGFRREHGLAHLPHPEPPEIALQEGTELVIPLWLRNQSSAVQEMSLRVNLPSGWTVASGEGKFTVAAKQTAAARMEVKLPLIGEGSKTEAQEVSVHAESKGREIGDVKLRVELRKRALPE